jgi:hypothetical protein
MCLVLLQIRNLSPTPEPILKESTPEPAQASTVAADQTPDLTITGEQASPCQPYLMCNCDWQLLAMLSQIRATRGESQLLRPAVEHKQARVS